MEHPYDALCGCNACEIEGHARDNIGDWTADDEPVKANEAALPIAVRIGHATEDAIFDDFF